MVIATTIWIAIGALILLTVLCICGMGDVRWWHPLNWFYALAMIVGWPFMLLLLYLSFKNPGESKWQQHT